MKCEFKNCKTRSTFNLEGEKVALFCSKHKEINMVDVKHKKCEFKDCKKRPTYNLEGEKKAIFCKEHKEINMVDVLNKTCDFKGCKKLPIYNFEGKKASFCNEHKEINMVNVNSKKCEFKDCKKIPTFNLEGKKVARFCSEHKEINMVDVKHKICEFKDCKKQSTFNLEGEVNTIFCSIHKEINMVDVKHKTCEFKGCRKTPVFNIEGEDVARFCKEHKEINMIDVLNKRCEFQGCKKRPNFNLEGELKACFCKEHKEENMIDIKNKTCEFKDCKKQPSFNIEGKKVSLFCYEHKEINMVDIKSKTCILCKKQSSFGLPGTSKTHCAKHKLSGMIRQPNKRCTSDEECKEPATHGIKEPLLCEQHALKEHYNLCERKCTNKECPYPESLDILNKEGLCVTFCSLIKQDHMMKKHAKKKEMFIGNLLKEEIKQDLCYQDEVIDSSCSKVRPDFVYDCISHIVIIEVDEHQHKSYNNCGTTKKERQLMENKRMYNIFQSFGDGRPLVFIRYNPDSFCVDGKLVKVSDKKRHECLLLWVKHYIKSKPDFKLEVKYLFYDDGYQSKISIEEKDVII